MQKEEDVQGIPTNKSFLTDDAIRVLNEGDTFGITNRWGDILPGNRQSHGLFHQDTRHLSKYQFKIHGQTPVLLSSELEEDNEILHVHLINPEFSSPEGKQVDQGDLYMRRSQRIDNGIFTEELQFRNYGQGPVPVLATLNLAADFRDIFEVRGFSRPAHGRSTQAKLRKNGLIFTYTGLDDTERNTEVQIHPGPKNCNGPQLEYSFQLNPGESFRIDMDIRMSSGQENINRREQVKKPGLPEINSDNEQFNHWLRRSNTDLTALFAHTEYGFYPYAGIPWFNTAFGRDGILSALSVLWLQPDLARDVLELLASTQAQLSDSFTDAEPGKILHERRKGEMAILREVPFGQNYGSVDATPLFVCLAGKYFRRTGDRKALKRLWPAVKNAMEWIKAKTSHHADGFLTYSQQQEKGLIHQGWKDANDAVTHQDGRLAEGPIALCEVQAYTFNACVEAAYLAAWQDDQKLAVEWKKQAKELASSFDQRFWDDKLQMYVMALDRFNEPCRVISSNAGQCLAFGIVPGLRAGPIHESLFSENMFTGWGIRTLGKEEARYSPLAYHNGSVWPHDNALIALGLSGYGYTKAANQLFHSLFDAALNFENQRLPELFCGFDRIDKHGPVPYPVACSPQAWSVASIYLMLKASLRMEIDAPSRTVSFIRPMLPEFIDNLVLENLPLSDGASLSLEILKYPNNTGINILKNESDWTIKVEK